MKTIIAAMGLLMFATFASGQQTTTVKNDDGTTTQYTSFCTHAGNCTVTNTDGGDGALFRDKVLYCTKGLNMPKDQVIVHHKTVSDVCDDAFTKKLIAGPIASDCEAMHKKLDRAVRECK